jgi:hypothetical protein
MSIPSRARELRQAFDVAQLFTMHIPGSRGCVHQLRVITCNKPKYVSILVESARYTIMAENGDENRLTEISDVIKAVQELLNGE